MKLKTCLVATILGLLDLSNVAVGGHLRSASLVSNNKVKKDDSLEKRSQNAVRKLQSDPSDPLRQFVSTAIIQAPDFSTSQDTRVGSFLLNLTNFQCFNLDFEDVILTKMGEADGSSDGTFQVEVTDILFQCSMNIGWGLGELGGDGSAFVKSNPNYLSAVMSADSIGRDYNPEEMCSDTVIDIDELSFNGDISVRVLNIYRGFIRRVIEWQVEDIFCQIMSEDLVGFILGSVETSLISYGESIPDSVRDPLYPETYLEQNEDVLISRGHSLARLVNFQDSNSSGTDFITAAIDFFNHLITDRKSDPNAPTEDQMDYGINTMLRNNALEDNRVLDLFKYENQVGFPPMYQKTPLADISVSVHAVRLYNLDTATVVQSIVPIGRRTVQTRLHWPGISIEMDVEVLAEASKEQGSLIANAEEIVPLSENFTARLGADDLDLKVALLIPIDSSEVEGLSVDGVINATSECVPFFMREAQFSELNLTIGEIQQTEFDGFESVLLGKIMTDALDVGVHRYEAAIKQALPAYFQTVIRDMLTSIMQEYRCPDEGSRRLQGLLDKDWWKPKAKVGHEGVSHRRRLLLEAEQVTEESAKNQRKPKTGPRRLQEKEEEFEPLTGEALYVNLLCAAVCVCTAALAAGLTMGLLSLDELMLLIKERAGATEKERKAAASLLPIVRQHHLLLVSLLLMNAMANEALPLFLDKLVGGFYAVILSVTLVLFFGEIIPSAVFTGPDQINLAASLAPLVKFVMLVLSPIAYPIAKVLDKVLHDEDHGGGYNRGELSALVRIQYESHLANKRHRKSQIKQAMKEYESHESGDSYASRRSSRSINKDIKKSTIRAIKRTMSTRSDLHIDEVTMVEGALQMGTTYAASVQTPWSEVFAIPNDMILNEKNSVQIYRSGFSRIPIFQKNPDDADDNTRVIGILSSRQLIVVNSTDKREVSTLPLAIPHCIAPDTPLVDLINMFQTGGIRGSHMAIVCSKPAVANFELRQGNPIPDDAGLTGVVTLEDVLEELIQEEIYDEYDRQERRRMKLARWGFQRWKMFVKKQKKKRSDSKSVLESREPRLLNVVTEAMAAHEGEPSETTSLLSRLNPFS